jgi:hypothetical protein
LLKIIALLIVSLIFAVAIFVLVYEVTASRRYDLWKAEFLKMTISRRGFFQAGAITVAGLGGYFILNGNTRTAIQAHLEQVFGADIAGHPDYGRFRE